jgi:hypothetical protein
MCLEFHYDVLTTFLFSEITHLEKALNITIVFVIHICIAHWLGCPTYYHNQSGVPARPTKSMPWSKKVVPACLTCCFQLQGNISQFQTN